MNSLSIKNFTRWKEIRLGLPSLLPGQAGEICKALFQATEQMPKWLDS